MIYIVSFYVKLFLLKHNDNKHIRFKYFLPKSGRNLNLLDQHKYIIRCEKAKMKRKIMAIWRLLLLIATPISIAEADETSEKGENNETSLVKFATFKSDGTLTTEKILSSGRFIRFLYLKIMLNNKILLYNESYILYRYIDCVCKM